MLVYLNGEFIRYEHASVPIDDRGFLFADGVYEVARVYGGRVFLMDEHLRRMSEGLAALRIRFDDVARVADVAERLLDENELRARDATIYVQVTRGAAPRAHAFPKPEVPATVLVVARPFKPLPDSYRTDGIDVITVPDTRWSRCDIKSIALVPNVLANQQAKEAGAFEALFVRDGVVIEGSHSNLFAVIGGTLVTYPACNYILDGITRRFLIALADELGIPVREGAILLEQLADVEELFISGTTTEVTPIARVDGRPVGGEKPGPLTRRLLAAYLERAGAPLAAAV